MSKKWICLGAIIILLMTLFFYIPALRGGYVWDDDYCVTDNLTLRTFDGLRKIWLEIGAVSQYYPLVHTSFWLEYHLWQLHPFGYHLVNVLLHALNAILLWLILRRLSIPGAWLAASIFALHPVHVESVAWISERKNVLSGFFYLSAILAYLRFLRLDVTSTIVRYHWGNYVLALGLYLCALLSKTVTCTMPATILLLLWWKRDRIGWRNVLLLLPHFALGAVLALTTVWLEKHRVGAQGEEWGYSFVERCLIAGRALWFYAGKLFWPHKLIFIYPRWQIDSGVWWQYFFPLTAGVVFIVLWLLRGQIGKAPLAAVLFFAGTLAPALGFFDVYPMRYSFVADHFQYLASIGLITLFVAVIVKVSLQHVPSYRNVGFVAFGVLMLILGILVWQQGHVYKDVETQWRDTILKNPNASIAYNNLGTVLNKQGRFDEGINCFKKALAINPNLAESHNNLGVAYSEKGRVDEAIEKYKQALAINPRFVKAHIGLGGAYIDKSMVDEAIFECKKAITIDPNYAEAHYNLGVAYSKKSRVDEAIEKYKQALAINPRFVKAHIGLGGAYIDKSMVDEAIFEYKEALTINPNHAKAHCNLGSAYGMKNMLDEAISEYKKAIAIDPNYAEAHYNLGVAYSKKGRVDEALSECKQAVDIKPDYAKAHSCLGVVYYYKGSYKLAIRHFDKAVELEDSISPNILELLKPYR